jgi:RimJ/RimL family protein N-acetyltransferase
MRIETVELEGPTLRLTPISKGCLPELTAAALSSPSIWEHIPYRVQSATDVEALLERATALSATGTGCVFATRLRESGALVGGTSIMAIDESLPSVEIGFTWLVPRWQRTRVNSEAKLLQLAHCFDALRCERVEFKTDIRNLRSRAALARIGATQEGILRAHRKRLDGSLRDSVMFSIVASEWPHVRQALLEKLRDEIGEF